VREKDRYDSLIQWYAGLAGVDWEIVKRQMLAESSANPHAISPVGAMGLMQFMPGTWNDVARDGEDPFDPEASLRNGTLYLYRLLKMFKGDMAKALAAYNWGPGNMRRVTRKWGTTWRDHLPGETARYLQRILREDT